MKRKVLRVLFTLALVVGLTLMLVTPASAAVSVTAATGGGAISADTAADATTPAWTDLGGITIAEQADGDFAAIQTDVTLILKAPSGFEFNSAQTPSINAAAGDITALTLTSITASLITVTFTTDGSADAGMDSIIIGATLAIQVRPTTGVLPTDRQIYAPTAGGGSATITGITTTDETDGGPGVATNFGTLGMVAGAATQLTFTVNPVSVSGLVFSTQPTIEAQDQHGNINTGFADDITILVKTGPGALDIGTATQPMTSGTLTTSGLGYTATADQEAFTLAANDAGIDLTEGVSGSVTCDVVATVITLTTAPASVISGVSMTTPVVTYVDGNGLVDVGIDADVITVTENGAGSVAGATATATDGVATFGSLIYTAVVDGESVTFTFTDDIANLNLNSLPVDSSALTADVVATKMAFFVQPLAGTNSGLVLGTQPTVQAQNADNTLDTGFTETVTITTDVGTLSGDVDIAAVLGVATFTDLVHTASADNQVTTLTADDVAGGAEGDLPTVDANTFTTLVIATKLVIVTQPAGAVSGVALVLQPVINAVDADGTLDADWVTACAVARETGTGDVTGGPVTPMLAGVATFIDVKVTESPVTHGSYTLRFTSTNLTDVVSDAFKVYDKVLDLNDDAWTLISTDDYVISFGDDTSAFEGAVSLKYIYTGSSYVPAYVSDIEPVEALYVKTTSDDGCLGLNYSTTASPGASNKSLLAGWNLISSATTTTADIVLSPLQYVQIGEQEGHGLATLVSQGDYNLISADWFVDTTTWGALIGYTMSPFDGYWVYMNAAKSFGVIPQPAP